MNFNERKNGWKHSLKESLLSALEEIGINLNNSTKAFDEFILLSSRNRENNNGFDKGIINIEFFKLEENRIRQSILDFINNIQEGDLIHCNENNLTKVSNFASKRAGK